MTALAAIILSLAGLAALALASPRHHRDLFGARPSGARILALRATGWTLLALSFASCIVETGAFIGIALWLGLATLAALTVALMLTYRDLWWRP